MMGIPELLGWSVGMMMGNPWILIAGYFVAKTSPREAKFWLQFFGAAVVCTVVSIAFESIVNGGSHPFGVVWLFVIVTLAVSWATLLFLLVRMLRMAFRGRAADANEV